MKERGLSQELIEVADERVTIPLADGVDSLNVAVATALLLYEAKKTTINSIVGWAWLLTTTKNDF